MKFIIALFFVPAVSFAQAKSFSGLWETSYGRMKLIEGNDKISGIYSYLDDSTVSGTRQKNKFTFTYKEKSTEGEGWFELSPDGEKFVGKWRPKNQKDWKDWEGTRVHPYPKVRWLVVIEAQWEMSLAEREFSFGNMLKSFFAKDPFVEVRQRRFTDEKSLRQWLREVAFVAEPVVISIASHGYDDGVSAGGSSYGADVIADSLQYADNVQVLNFSACLVMKGGVPAAIQKKLGKRAFPISGYKTSVDWGFSAVTEFLYYELILAKGHKPEKAAQILLEQLPAAGNKTIKPFESLGFTFLKP